MTVNGVAKWDGEQWSDLDGGLDGGGWFDLPGPAVFSFQVYDDGSGEALYVGGTFEETAGGMPVNNIARWDGEEWSGVGGGVDEALAYESVETMLVRDGLLYVGGNFEFAGGNAIERLATWDGNEWSPLAPGGVSNYIFDMTFYDDGEREDLYVVGGFFTIDGVESRFLARYDGEQWHQVGGGINGGQAHQIEVYDGVLYVSGLFNEAGGQPVSRIAAWDGRNWSDLNGGVGTGFQTDVRALHVFDDGTGERLYVGGLFTQAGNVSGLSNLAAWDGARWIDAFDGGVNSRVRAFATVPGEATINLHLGGEFTTAGGSHASRFAIWSGCKAVQILPGDLDGNGSVGVEDLLALLSQWGRCADPPTCTADLDDDDIVSVSDLLVLLDNWG